jgi:hypothetical protein
MRSSEKSPVQAELSEAPALPFIQAIYSATPCLKAHELVTLIGGSAERVLSKVSNDSCPILGSKDGPVFYCDISTQGRV